MKISSITYNIPKVSFGDALSTKQEKDLVKLAQRIEQKENEARQQKGDYKAPITAAYFYPYALPNKPNALDDGVGKVNSQMAKDYYKKLKVYGNVKAIQFPPLTQVTDAQVYNDNHSGSPYKGSGLALSEAIINLPNLATKDYGYLLTKEEVKRYIDTHKDNIQQQLNDIKNRYTNNKIDPEAFIDLQTPLGWKNQEDYPINDYLKIAYRRFLDKENKDPKIVELRKEFKQFKSQKEPVNYDVIYTRLALFPYMKDWATSSVDFFKEFDNNDFVKKAQIKRMVEWFENSSKAFGEQRAKQYAQDNDKEYSPKLAQQYAKERKDEIIEAIDFYKFKQFICRKELKSAVDYIHSLGMEVYGDMLFGNSWVEEQMFPDAFLKRPDGTRAEIGDMGGIPAYNFSDLASNGNTAAKRFLEQKIGFNLDYFDGIRLDMGWEYIRPYYHYNRQYADPMQVGTKITDFIASCAKKFKGNNFDTRKLMYECDADGRDFSIQNQADLIKRTQGTMVLSTVHERADNGGFGSLKFYKEKLGFDDDKIIICANTHDNPGVIELADNSTLSTAHTGALMELYNLDWTEFKSNDNPDEHRRKMIRGRLAEKDLAKNHLDTYLNIFGRREKLDYHTNGSIHGGFESAIDYKNRLQRKSEEWFHDALRAGVAYNWPEVKLFNIEHANKNPDGSEKVSYGDDYFLLQKYAAYLKRNTGISTTEQADASDMAKVNIEDMTLEEINNP